MSEEKEKYTFKDIDPILTNHFKVCLIWDLIITLFVVLILCLCKLFSLIPIVALIAAVYALSIVYQINYCLKGKCLKIEGRVIKSVKPDKAKKIGRLVHRIQKKDVDSRIIIAVQNSVSIDIPLHQINDFEKNNDVVLFVPENGMSQETEDGYFAFKYYYLVKIRENAVNDEVSDVDKTSE